MYCCSLHKHLRGTCRCCPICLHRKLANGRQDKPGWLQGICWSDTRRLTGLLKQTWWEICRRWAWEQEMTLRCCFLLWKLSSRDTENHSMNQWKWQPSSAKYRRNIKLWLQWRRPSTKRTARSPTCKLSWRHTIEIFTEMIQMQECPGMMMGKSLSQQQKEAFEESAGTATSTDTKPQTVPRRAMETMAAITTTRTIRTTVGGGSSKAIAITVVWKAISRRIVGNERKTRIVDRQTGNQRRETRTSRKSEHYRSKKRSVWWRWMTRSIVVRSQTRMWKYHHCGSLVSETDFVDERGDVRRNAGTRAECCNTKLLKKSWRIVRCTRQLCRVCSQRQRFPIAWSS